jgi:predicted dehydrogenase
MKRLKVAIVGCGKIADGHVQQIEMIDCAELVAVCDREPLMAEQLAVRFGVPRWYMDVDEMLRNHSIDVLHITTPPQSHLSLALKAFEAGAHVLVEKPVAPTLQETDALIQAVSRYGQKLTVNYWYQFERPALDLRQLLASDAIGKVVHIESLYGYNFSGAYGQAVLTDPNHWVYQLPGGAFHNVLDHVINKIVPLLPEAPVNIWPVTFATSNHGDPISEELRVSLQCGGVSAYATVSGSVRPVGHSLRVYGTKNTVHVDFNSRTIVLETQQPFPSALGRLLPPFITAQRYLRNAISNCGDFLASRAHYFYGMNRLFTLFYDSILSDTEPPIPMRDVYRVAAIMEEIFTSKAMGVSI